MSLADRYRRPVAALAEQPGWPAARRARALDQFERLGLPHRKQEDWRFTDLRRLSAVFFPLAKAEPQQDPMAVANAHRLPGARLLTLVNGRFAPGLSDSPADGFHPLAADLSTLDIAAPTQGLEALNQALFTDGARLEIASSADRLYQILHIGSSAEPATAQCRLHIRLGPHARATLVESWTGAAKSQHWVGVGSQIALARSACLTHVKLIAEPESAVHTASQTVDLAERARYGLTLLALGVGLGRQDLRLRHGPHSHYDCQALYGLRDRQHFTLASRSDHCAPCATTDQRARCVLEDSAHGVFQGMIAVAANGQKTDARQGVKALLLSDGARIDIKPELEIFADDVKCAHGATVGALAAEALFYLQARGIASWQARAMLTEAFALEALEGVAEPSLRSALEHRVRAWFQQGAAP